MEKEPFNYTTKRWFTEQKAKGICYVCKRKITSSRTAHKICVRLQNAQKDRARMTFAEVQKYLLTNNIDPNIEDSSNDKLPIPSIPVHEKTQTARSPFPWANWD